MKLRNSLAILCSAAFCFTLALTGCNQKGGNQGGGGNTVDAEWTITFDSRGGSQVESQKVKDGELAVKPTNPTKENFVFDKWCEDQVGVTPFDFNAPIKSDWTLYASWRNGDGPTPPEPVTGDYYAVIGGVEKAMTSNSERIAETQTGNFVCTFASLTEGQIISFLDGDKNAIADFGPDLDYDGGHNNVVNDSGAYKVHNSATNVQVSFRTWNDGGYSFWVNGYESQGGQVVGDVVYTVTNMPNWITNDGCVVYAWTWGTGDAGSWHATVYTSETELKFGVDAEKDGFLLARCVAGTTQPDWDATGDNTGRIYNKTGDVTCSSGNYTYQSPEWEGYTPSGGQGGGGGEQGNAHGPAGSTLVSWYIVGQGSFSTNDWQISGGVQLYSNPGSDDKGCILNMSFAAGDTFKVTNGTDWYGYDKVDQWDDPSNKGRSCFAGANDGYGGTNIKCTTAGSYDIYVNKDGNFWIQSAA